MTEDITSESLPDIPLGVKSPLATHKPLGQNFISPKFIQPLGAKTISFLHGSMIQGLLVDNGWGSGFTDGFREGLGDRQLQKSSLTSQPTHPTQTTSSTPPPIQPLPLPQDPSPNPIENPPELNTNTSPENPDLQQHTFPDYDTSSQPTIQPKSAPNKNKSNPNKTTHLTSKNPGQKTQLFRSIITSSNPQTRQPSDPPSDLNPTLEDQPQSTQKSIIQPQTHSTNPPKFLSSQINPIPPKKQPQKNIQKKHTLTTIKPLNQNFTLSRKPLPKPPKTPPTQTHQNFDSKVPEQWSSIEELMGETLHPTSPSPVDSESPTSPSIQSKEYPTASTPLQRTVEENAPGEILATENISPSGITSEPVQRLAEENTFGEISATENVSPSETEKRGVNNMLNLKGDVLNRLPESEDILQGRWDEGGKGLMKDGGLLGRRKKGLNVKQAGFLPAGISIGAKGQVSSSDLTNQPRNLERLIQESLKSRSELKEKISRRKASEVKPISRNETELYEYSKKVIDKEEDEEKEEEKKDVVEFLAREVYGLIRERLAIEQERYGSFYSGRLPW
jgi:hypothetical protein